MKPIIVFRGLYQSYEEQLGYNAIKTFSEFIIDTKLLSKRNELNSF